jgi:hypothetical protein
LSEKIRLEGGKLVLSLRGQNYEARRQHDRSGLKQKDENYTSAHMLRQIKRVVKFWREYFGDKPVSSIGDAQLKGYVDWRRNYYARYKVLPKMPSDTPLTKHCFGK